MIRMTQIRVDHIINEAREFEQHPTRALINCLVVASDTTRIMAIDILVDRAMKAQGVDISNVDFRKFIAES